MNFEYENQGHITYLSYSVSQNEIIDTMCLGMITNNRINGLAACVYTQSNMEKYIKYNVSAKIPVNQFFSGAVSKKRLLTVFDGIAAAMIAAEDYMIAIESLVLDLNYIFIDVSTCEVSLICLPVQRENAEPFDVNAFFKNIMFSTHFDQTENGDYIAKIINFERVGRERTCGDNHNAVCGYLRHLAADYTYKRIFFDCLCDKGGEIVPVNG